MRYASFSDRLVIDRVMSDFLDSSVGLSRRPDPISQPITAADYYDGPQ